MPWLLGRGFFLFTVRSMSQEMRLFWMKTSEAWTDASWMETSFTCFDEDKPGREGDGLWDTYIGGVHQEPHGP